MRTSLSRRRCGDLTRFGAARVAGWRRRWVGAFAVVAVAAGSLAGCGDTADDTDADRTVTLLTHESFDVSEEVLAAFRKDTGLTVKVLRAGDAGTVVNQAVLTRGKPRGDVLFGVDNTFLSRALDAGIFTPYQAAGLGAVPAAYRLDPRHRATPVDFGDVCVNYDKAWFTARKLAPPRTYADLVRPEYRNLLVVQNPATSSPGLAFLLGSVAVFGQDGWKDWWTRLRANGALVVDGWEEAYYQRFTVGSKGKANRPLVVSYASSPAAEVLFAERKPATAPTGVATGTCFRQVEFAGLLDGAANPDGGRKLLDFLLSAPFQRDLPTTMFVYPVVPGTPLPAEFRQHAPVPGAPLTLPPATIAAERDGLLKQWTATVLR